MIKMDVIYDNPFDESEQIQETLWFHLYPHELVRWFNDSGFSKPDDMQKYVETIMTSGDSLKIMPFFEDLMLRSYGVREGNKHRKSPAIRAEFEGSPAFARAFMDIVTSAVKAAEFFNGVVPKNLDAELTAVQAQNEQNAKTVTQLSTGMPLTGDHALEEQMRASGLEHPIHEGKIVAWWDREPTPLEQQTMTHKQLLDVFRRKSSGWIPKPV